MHIKYRTEESVINDHYNIIPDYENCPLSNCMSYSYKARNGNGLGTMTVSITIHNLLSDNNPYAEYKDTNIKSFCGSIADGDYDITYNGFNYINFMDEIGMNKRGKVISYVEDNYISSEGFYMLEDDDLDEIDMDDDDYELLKEALHNVRACMKY